MITNIKENKEMKYISEINASIMTGYKGKYEFVLNESGTALYLTLNGKVVETLLITYQEERLDSWDVYNVISGYDEQKLQRLEVGDAAWLVDAELGPEKVRIDRITLKGKYSVFQTGLDMTMDSELSEDMADVTYTEGVNWTQAGMKGQYPVRLLYGYEPKPMTIKREFDGKLVTVWR